MVTQAVFSRFFYENCKMSSTARIVVLLSFIALCVCDTSAKPTAREYLKRGDIQLSRNNLVQAISNYTKAMS